ncbi:MAG TPA: SAP domain-containing protein [Saprospiraceae bacterium]|nr:SAP domain-containing protein [Saprospiraceae bacterium]
MKVSNKIPTQDLRTIIENHFPSDLEDFIDKDAFYERQFKLLQPAIVKYLDQDTNAEQHELSYFLPTTFLFPLMSQQVETKGWLSKVKSNTFITDFEEQIQEAAQDDQDDQDDQDAQDVQEDEKYSIYNEMTVAELKLECEKRTIKKSGTKKVLIEKIIENEKDTAKKLKQIVHKKKRKVIKTVGTPVPFTIPYVKKNLNLFTFKRFKMGVDGVVEFILEITKNGGSYQCKDKSRLTFDRLDKGKVTVKDFKGAFIHLVLDELEGKSIEYFSKIKKNSPNLIRHQNTHIGICAANGHKDEDRRAFHRKVICDLRDTHIGIN